MKIHVVTDGLGSPLHFLLTGRNRSNIRMSKELLGPSGLMGKIVLADKGYDSCKFAKWVEGRGEIVVIPSRITTKHPQQTDWNTYKERHLIETLFLKLKNNRRFATRYEKKAACFQAVTFIARILVWLL